MKTVKQLNKEYDKSKKQLGQKYKRDFKKIQDACKHFKISGWQEEYEDNGFGLTMTGREIRYCEKCLKPVSHRPLTQNKDVFRLGYHPEQNNK